MWMQHTAFFPPSYRAVSCNTVSFIAFVNVLVGPIQWVVTIVCPFGREKGAYTMAAGSNALGNDGTGYEWGSFVTPEFQGRSLQVLPLSDDGYPRLLGDVVHQVLLFDR